MKVSRQAKILELIAENEIETQEEIARLLNESGYNVTQATVSRDLRELKLTKVTVERGRQKYIELQQAGSENMMIDKYVRILQNGFVSVDNAMNIRGIFIRSSFSTLLNSDLFSIVSYWHYKPSFLSLVMMELFFLPK